MFPLRDFDEGVYIKDPDRTIRYWNTIKDQKGLLQSLSRYLNVSIKTQYPAHIISLALAELLKLRSRKGLNKDEFKEVLTKVIALITEENYVLDRTAQPKDCGISINSIALVFSKRIFDDRDNILSAKSSLLLQCMTNFLSVNSVIVSMQDISLALYGILKCAQEQSYLLSEEDVENIHKLIKALTVIVSRMDGEIEWESMIRIFFGLEQLAVIMRCTPDGITDINVITGVLLKQILDYCSLQEGVSSSIQRGIATDISMIISCAVTLIDKKIVEKETALDLLHDIVICSKVITSAKLLADITNLYLFSQEKNTFKAEDQKKIFDILSFSKDKQSNSFICQFKKAVHSFINGAFILDRQFENCISELLYECHNKVAASRQISRAIAYIAKILMKTENFLRPHDVTHISTLLNRLCQTNDLDFENIPQLFTSISVFCSKIHLIDNNQNVVALLLQLNKHYKKYDVETIGDLIRKITQITINDSSIYFRSESRETILSLLKQFCNLIGKSTKPSLLEYTLWSIATLFHKKKLYLNEEANNRLIKIFNTFVGKYVSLKIVEPTQIANALLSIGQLAETALLPTEKIDKSAIHNLLKKFTQSHPSLDDISMSFAGLAKLVAPEKFFLCSGSRESIRTLLASSLLERPNSTEDVSKIAHIFFSTAILSWYQQYNISEELFRKFSRILNPEVVKQLDLDIVTQYCQAMTLLNKKVSSDLKDIVNRSKEVTITGEQKRVKRALERIFKEENVNSEHFIGIWFVDLYVKENGRRIIFEIDGCQHRLSDGTLIFKDQRRDKCLIAKGYEIFHLTNQEIAQCNSDDLVGKLSGLLGLNSRKRPNNDTNHFFKSKKSNCSRPTGCQYALDSMF
jgi:very-short-patch-repair endonuclease